MEQLDEIIARADEATEGPWVVFEGDEANGVDSATRGQITWDDHGGQVFKPADAEFIAHARTDVPKLVIALKSVRILHVAEGNGNCVVCWDFNNDVSVKYPCPTVAAITEILNN